MYSRVSDRAVVATPQRGHLKAFYSVNNHKDLQLEYCGFTA